MRKARDTDLERCQRLSQALADEREEAGYICNDCADKRGGKWPEGHVATFHDGTCGFCGQRAGLCAVDDYDWSSSSRRPRGYGGGRD